MNLTFRNTLTYTTLLLTLFFLASCSSSSSETSSGSGSSNSASNTPAANGTPMAEASGSTFAGTYVGTATVTVSALGISQAETVPVTITIDQNNQMTIQSGSDVLPNAVTMNGNAFSQSQTLVNEDFGSAVCSGTLTLQGNINNNTALAATLGSQSVSCVVNGATIPGTVSGTLNATKS